MTDVPPTDETTAAAPAPPASREKAQTPDPPWWFAFFAVLVLWAVVMSLLQHRSLLNAVATLYGMFFIFALAIIGFAPHWLRRGDDKGEGETLMRVSVAGLLVTGSWVLLIGSHGWWWDFLAAYVAASAVVLFVVRPALKEANDRMTPTTLLRFIIWGSAAVWFGLGLMDRWFHRTPVSHDVKRFESLASPPRPFAVALSGGGYRAVLFHAGVLHALEQLELRPSHISSVSGGSIVGAFYARGGAPVDLMRAVAGRRFNLRRDLADFYNAPRLAFPMTLPMFDTLLFPWWSFSRLDVQANLLDDLLLGGDALPSLYAGGTLGAPPNGRPWLMLNATDVNYGIGIGLTADGFLVTSATNAAWIPPAFPSAFEGGRLARLAAISGAFPGAFPATNVEFDAAGTHPLKDVQLSLADGGVLDNSGVRHLLVLYRLATGGNAFCGNETSEMLDRARKADAHRVVEGAARDRQALPKQWRYETIIASDAGKPFRPPNEPMSRLETEVDSVDRAVSLAGLHASVPLDKPCPGDPAAIWLYPEALVDVVGKRAPSDTTIDHIATWIPRTRFDAERRRSPSWPPVAWARKRLGRPQPTLLSDLCACETAESPLDGRSLSQDDRSYLAAQIRDDIAAGVELFMKTSTLNDTFPTRDAYALFRLGMYAVFEQSGKISAATGTLDK